MRTIKVLLVLFALLINGIGKAQQLTFRVTNPVIMHTGGSPGFDIFQFDLETKCDIGTTYLWGGQAQFTLDNATFLVGLSNWSVVKGTLLNGTNTASNFKYTLGKNIVTVGSNKEFYISWAGDFNVFSNGLDNGLGDWNLVPTTWTQVCQVRGRINAPTGLAGIDMHESVFNGVQQQYITGYSTSAPYLNPNFFDTRDFTTTYVNRVYCNTYGWSQYATTTTDGQAPVVWTSSVNTSVWDTIGGSAAPVTLAGSLVNNLRIHSTAHMAIDYTASLTASGTIEINAPKGIIVKSHTSAPFQRGQLLDNGTAITYNNGGSVNVWASFPQDAWHYYCIPFTQASMTSVRPYSQIYMKYYEEISHTGHWKYVWANNFSPDTNLLTMQMRGYAMWASSTLPYIHPGTVYPSGPINTGAVSITCTRSSYTGTGGGYDGWNLIGNPYTSSIDLYTGGGGGAALTCPANVDPTAYYWDGSAYITYNWSTQVGTGTRFPAPQQGFLVHVNSDLGQPTTAIITANQSGRVVTNGTPTKDIPAIPDYIILTANANGISDDAHIAFNPDATIGFDAQFDAYKLFGTEASPNFYSRMDTIMAVNELPWTGINQIVPMGFYLGVAAPVTITASNLTSFKPETKIYLEDVKEAKMQELTLDPVYTFTASPNDNVNRFVLHFYNPSAGIINTNLTGMQIYSFDEYLYVRNLVTGTTKGTIQMYDLLGRRVFQGNLKDMELNKYLPGVNEGYYMVRVVTEDNSYTQKVYLK